MESMSCGLGRPVTSRMRSSWFMVDVPGKMGLPLISSPRMQPAGGTRRNTVAEPAVLLVQGEGSTARPCAQPHPPHHHLAHPGH